MVFFVLVLSLLFRHVASYVEGGGVGNAVGVGVCASMFMCGAEHLSSRRLQFFILSTN